MAYKLVLCKKVSIKMRGRMDGAARAAPLTRLICIAMQASARLSPRGLYFGADRGGDQVRLHKPWVNGVLRCLLEQQVGGAVLG